MAHVRRPTSSVEKILFRIRSRSEIVRPGITAGRSARQALDWLALMKEDLSFLSADEQAQILGKSALAVWPDLK